MTNHIRTIARKTRLGVVGAAAALAVGAATVTPAAAAKSTSSASVAGGTLTIASNQGDDSIAIRLAPGVPGTLQVDVDDDGTAEFEFDRSTFTRIEAFTGNGDDQVRVDQVNGSFADEAITVDGGNGDDVLDGGDGNELFLGGRGDDAVDGNRGADSALLGPGDDSFRWDPGDGSDVVEGLAGFDTLDFNGATGAENMSLSANGERALFFRVQGDIRMDMNDVERLDLTTLEGVDTFTVDDMSGTDVTVADVDLAGATGRGDASADAVTVNATAADDQIRVATDGGPVAVEGLATSVRMTGTETIDRLQINSLDGNDNVDVEDDVAALITVAVDLGSGQL
jgi:hypothetical protein